MKDRILKILSDAGHGLTPRKLWHKMYDWDISDILDICIDMEEEHILILHRADGSANTCKGEIVLVCLRPKEIL